MLDCRYVPMILTRYIQGDAETNVQHMMVVQSGEETDASM